MGNREQSTIWFSKGDQPVQALDATFAALSDSTRRAILQHLSQGEAQLSDLAEPFQMTQTAVSKHVRVLNKAGLVAVEKRGRARYCKLTGAALKSASEWLADYEKFWTDQFDNLAMHLVKTED